MNSNDEISDVVVNLVVFVLKLAIVVIAVVFLSQMILVLSIYLSISLPLQAETSTLLDLSVNSILVAVTSIYVLATWGILTKTGESIKLNEESIKLNEKSIKLNEKNIELTLNTQKRILIQQQLELFYIPASDFLKSTIHLREKSNKDGEMIPYLNSSIQIRNEEYKENTQCNKIISHSYLAR